MAREQERQVTPSSLFPSLPSFTNLPELWEEMGNRMNRWMSVTNYGVSEDENNVYVEANLPGLKQEDLDISVHQNTLFIRGQRKTEEQNKQQRFYSKVQRSFSYQIELPCRVEEERAQAHYEDGVLYIQLPKTTQSNVRKIRVNNGNSQQKNENQQTTTQQQKKNK